MGSSDEPRLFGLLLNVSLGSRIENSANTPPLSYLTGIHPCNFIRNVLFANSERINFDNSATFSQPYSLKLGAFIKTVQLGNIR